MCGVPHHSAENYIFSLINQGFRVAICEQMESPEEAKKRGYKAVVKRDVVRLITPGTLTEERLLNDEQNNFLLSCNKTDLGFSVAWTDISTGEFMLSSGNKEYVNNLIQSFEPKEILVSKENKKKPKENHKKRKENHKTTIRKT